MRRAGAKSGGQFLMFGAIGVVGFGVDASVLHLAAPLAGPYAGRLLSFLIAMSVTFLLNRAITFRHAAPRHHRPGVQWARYGVANAVGGACNLALYAVLAGSMTLFAENLWAAVAAGSLAGWAINFALSRRFVF